jgi:ubiquinone/menaquinone biosynthesis C-methylase UbiE
MKNCGIEKTAIRFPRKAKLYSERNEEHITDLEELISFIEPQKSEECLDVATGTGGLAIALASHCKNVRAVDIATGMLREAEKKKT